MPGMRSDCPPIEYLEWTQARPDSILYDFASSNLTRASGKGVPDVLQDLPSPPPDASLESLVAAQYCSDVTASNVLITAGATTANATAAAVAIEQARDDGHPTVLTEAPGYEPLAATPRALGADVEYFARTPESGYTVTPESLHDGLDEDVCLVSMTNRHNPSGRLLSRETLAAVAEPVANHDCTLLVDEVYAPFVADPETDFGTAFGGPTAAGNPATIVSNSLTKFFGFNALRIGWLLADSDVVRRCATMQRHLLDVSPMSRDYARIILHNAEMLAEHSRRRLRENSALLREFVAEIDGLRGQVDPEHAMAFLDYADFDGDAVAEEALAADVSVVPGRFFGNRSRFRMSVSREPSTMAEGLRAFQEVLESM